MTTAALTSQPFRLGHEPALDGLRGVSILLVLVAHIQLLEPRLAGYFGGGFLGVDVFFVISGFLITSLLVEEIQATGRVSLKDFYIRRGLRLLPALVVIVSMTCLLGAALGSLSLVGLSGFRLLSIAGYFTNWVRVFESPKPWLLGHFWSLSVEEQFYLLWPATLILLFRLRRARLYVLLILTTGILVSFILKAFLYTNGAPPQRLIFGSDTRAEPILFGCLLAVLLHWNLLRFLSKQRTVLSAFALAAVFLVVSFTDQDFPGMYFGGFTLFAISCCLIILKIAIDKDSTLSKALSSKVMVWIGRRSYGIYLWHWPAFKLIKAFPLPVSVFVPLAMITTFLIAGISYRYVEAPFLSMKKRFTSKQMPRLAAWRTLDSSRLGMTTQSVAPAGNITQEVGSQ